jgi:predicted nucleic acid-binding protein
MSNSVPVAVADTGALLHLFDGKSSEHDATRRAVESVGHLVVSPFVLAELDYLITRRIGSDAALRTLEYVSHRANLRRFEVPEVGPHLHVALTVMQQYRDADGGDGVGLTDAMNVALAAEFRTTAMLSTDHRHFRMMLPLTGESGFRLLPIDL